MADRYDGIGLMELVQEALTRGVDITGKNTADEVRAALRAAPAPTDPALSRAIQRLDQGVSQMNTNMQELPGKIAAAMQAAQQQPATPAAPTTPATTPVQPAQTQPATPAPDPHAHPPAPKKGFWDRFADADKWLAKKLYGTKDDTHGTPDHQ